MSGATDQPVYSRASGTRCLTKKVQKTANALRAQVNPIRKIVIPHGESGSSTVQWWSVSVLRDCSRRPCAGASDTVRSCSSAAEIWTSATRLWMRSKGGAPDTDCNIQFGEGGATAYRTVKPTTAYRHPPSDNVLENRRARCPRISSKAKPHVGMDILKNVVREMRREIIKNGGSGGTRRRPAFRSKTVRSAPSRQTGADIACERAVLHIGHSRARHLCRAQTETACTLEPKVLCGRAHRAPADRDRPRSYGKAADIPCCRLRSTISRAEPTGRACYSFCMCPGAAWSLHRAKRTRSSPTA